MLSPRAATAWIRRQHPATFVATLALVVAVSDVSPADAVSAVRHAVFAQNAGSVGGIKASRTPKAGRLLPLGADAKVPDSALPNLLRGPRGPQGPGGSVGASGPIGQQGAGGPPGARGPSSARIVTPGEVELSRNAGVFVPVATMNSVEPGSYIALFTAEANYRAANTRGYVVCEVRVNGAGVGSTKAIVGDGTGSTGSLNLARTVPVTKSASFDLSAVCYLDQNVAAGVASARIEGQALTLIKVDSVSVG